MDCGVPPMTSFHGPMTAFFKRPREERGTHAMLNILTFSK